MLRPRTLKPDTPGTAPASYALPTAAPNMPGVDVPNGDAALYAGKTILIPPMAPGGARVFASVFKRLKIGSDARTTNPSDHRTLDLADKHLTGDECFPARVTLGDFLKAVKEPGVDPATLVLFMPGADGPCRFGQYAPYFRRVLDAEGFTATTVLSPSSANSYQGLGRFGRVWQRIGWRALVSSDQIEKLALMTRPYERDPGATDRANDECLADLCSTIETMPDGMGRQLRAMAAALARCRDRLQAVSVTPTPATPLVGVVGEIFCRLNPFSNQDVIRGIERHGGEAWNSGVSEWVDYTLTEPFRKLRVVDNLWSSRGAVAWLVEHVAHKDEHALLAPLRKTFGQGYTEPSARELLGLARPYLPSTGALGEMVLSVGKAVWLAKNGADGVIDASPFSCMNGIVAEAVYPKVSRDFGGIPIRTIYFDGTRVNMDRTLGVFLEAVRAYQARKPVPRPAPVPWVTTDRGAGLGTRDSEKRAR